MESFEEGGELRGRFPWKALLAKVAVVGGGTVDRTTEIELADNLGRVEAEDLLHGGENLRIRQRTRAKSVEVQAGRLRVANGVGKLEFAAFSGASGDNNNNSPAFAVPMRSKLARCDSRGSLSTTMDSRPCHDAVCTSAGRGGVAHPSSTSAAENASTIRPRAINRPANVKA